MPIEVRTLDGVTFTFDLSDESIVRNVKALLEERSPGLWSSRLLYKGKILKDDTTLGSIAVPDGDFLTAIGGKKRRCDDQAPRPVLEKPRATDTAADHHVPRNVATPQNPPSTELDTLLPGYASRPNPSPQKPRLPASISIQSGVGEATHSRTQDCSAETSHLLCGKGPGATLVQLAAVHAARDARMEIVEVAPAPRSESSPPHLDRSRELICREDGSHGCLEKKRSPAAVDEIACLPELKLPAASIMASLPLPEVLQEMQRHFLRLAEIHDFLVRTSIHPTWNKMCATMQALGMHKISFNSVRILAMLCPEVLVIGDDAVGDFPIALADPWSAREGEGVPLEFIEELTSIISRVVNEAIEPLEVGNDITATLLKEKRQRRRTKGNKRIRQAWVLRVAMIACVTLLQTRYFEDAVPAIPAASRSSGMSMRRSRMGKQRKAAACVDLTASSESQNGNDISTMTYLPGEGGQTLLENLLQQGKWHPDLCLKKITLSQVQSAAQDLSRHPASAHGRAITTRDGAAAFQEISRLTSVADASTVTRLHHFGGISHPNRPAAPPQVLRRHPPCRSTTPLDPMAFLDHLRQLPGYKDQVVHVEHVPARPSCNAIADFPIHAVAAAALKALGVPALYSHQARAIETLRSGLHTVVATSTASGKSLCYTVPILEALAQDRSSTALLIFPTKALAQDQRRALSDALRSSFGDEAAPSVEIYDGDTPMDMRSEIRDRAQILITNPDMLHLSILPVHQAFSRLLSNLSYCVIDEAHSYRGVFGAHAALVFRRLRRVCARVFGHSPTFVITTATLANPAQHACNLVGLNQVTVIDKDGSPHGPRQFVLWNPPLLPSGHDEHAEHERGADMEGMAQGNKHSSVSISRSELKRLQQEKRRDSLRAARQERHAGVALGQQWGEMEWTAAVSRGTLASSSKRHIHVQEPGSNGMPALSEPHEQARKKQTQQQAQLTRRQQRLVAEASAAISLVGGDVMKTAAPTSIRGGNCPNNIIRLAPLGSKAALQAMTMTSKSTKSHARQHAHAEPEVPLVLPRGIDSKPSSICLEPAPSFRRSSPIVEIASLLAECVQHGLRTIAFCKSRKLSELVASYTREILRGSVPSADEQDSLAAKVAVYRSGYSPSERREIESALFAGRLLGVAATNALELGVDIGGLDVTLHLGFPGSIASLWQQAGRAGRREQACLSIYVGWDGPLDQFFFSNPRSLFARPIEAATIDPNNPSILQAHLACAAAEVPILVQEPNEMSLFGPYLVQAAMLLRQRGLLGCSPDTHNGQLHYTGPSNKPASTLTLRTIDPGRFTIVDQSAGNVVLEEVEESMAFYQVYDGAVYMFQGKTYLCSSLDFASRVALVKRSDYIKYYTRIVDFKDVSVVGGNNAYLTPRMLEGSTPGSDHSINQELSSSASTPSFLPTSAVFAPALVTTRWLGFLRIQRGTGRLIDKVDLHDYPDMQYETEATYLRLPAIARQRLQAAGLPFRDGVHAASHAVLNVLPLLCIADPADVATECDNPYDTRYKPERILLYDAQSGGVGISCAARPVFTELLKRAFSLVSSCGCTYVAGCPSCVQRSGCGEYNRVLNKTAGLLVLEAALEAEAQKFGLTREQAGLPALPLMQTSFDSITDDE